jgi:hypothetical protein
MIVLTILHASDTNIVHIVSQDTADEQFQYSNCCVIPNFVVY